MRYWFVNLGKYYNAQRNGQFIWAPIKNEFGSVLQHWENLMYINKGDIILCNKKGNIMAIAIANGPAYSCNIPDSFEQSWRPEGRRVDLTFYDLKKPFRFKDYKDEYLNDIDYDKNPFDVNGNAKLGYLFPIEKHIAEFLIDKINDKEINKLIYNVDTELIEEIEEVVEENEQFEKINNGSIKPYSIEEANRIDSQNYHYEERTNEGKKKVLRVKTDPKLKATRMELANHNCEINQNHKTFTNSSGKYQYLECHHIIPLNAQKDFPNIKLDSMFNIIAVCPICHMQVHHAKAEEKGEIFSIMYNIRKDEMLEHGFDLAKINQVFKKYYLNKKEEG